MSSVARDSPTLLTMLTLPQGVLLILSLPHQFWLPTLLITSSTTFFFVLISAVRDSPATYTVFVRICSTILTTAARNRPAARTLLARISPLSTSFCSLITRTSPTHLCPSTTPALHAKQEWRSPPLPGTPSAYFLDRYLSTL